MTCRPHGPYWAVSSDVTRDGALLVYFDAGSINRDIPALFLPPEGDTVVVGRLAPNGHTLTNVARVKPSKVLEWNCMKIPRIEEELLGLESSSETFKLPIKVTSS